MKKKEILENVEEYVRETSPPKKFIPGKTIIPASGADIRPEDISSIVESALQGWFTDFFFCQRFREEISKVVGKKYVVLTNSGSSASLLAVSACLGKWGWGYEVITTAVGFPTTVAPIIQKNREPRFIDINPKTLSPNWDQFFEVFNVTNQVVDGYIFAYTLGFPFNNFARKSPESGFMVLDCCDALGVDLTDNFSDIITLSFFPAHHITTGEGGAVCTDDEELFELMRSYANWGRDCYCKPGQSNTCGKRFQYEFKNMPNGYDHKYTFSRFGYNLKMTEMQAALGLSQIKRLPEIVRTRRSNYDKLYIGMPGKFEEYFYFIEVPEWSKPSPFGFPMVRRSGVPFGLSEFIRHLELHKITTRRLFGGNLTRQPMFDHWNRKNLPDLSGSNKLMDDLVWIGCHPGITDEMIEYIHQKINDFFTERGL
jgi:CDP-6-deoxy-D-xylo-4-hexulose-3-dehydrase